MIFSLSKKNNYQEDDNPTGETWRNSVLHNTPMIAN